MSGYPQKIQLFNPYKITEVADAVLSLINEEPNENDLVNLVNYAKKFSLTKKNKEITEFWSKILYCEKKNFNFNK